MDTSHAVRVQTYSTVTFLNVCYTPIEFPVFVCIAIIYNIISTIASQQMKQLVVQVYIKELFTVLLGGFFNLAYDGL